MKRKIRTGIFVLWICVAATAAAHAADAAGLGAAVTTLRFLAGRPVNAFQLDVTNDGKVDIDDALYRLQVSAGLRYENPCPEIVLLTPTGTDTVQMAWLPAATPSTPPEDMAYEAHMSTTPGFTPGPGTLRAALTGEAQAEITGLAPGTTYYALVVAVDSAGIRRRGSEYKSVDTFPEAVSVNTSLIHIAEEIGLGAALVSGEEYIYSPGPDATIPPAGGFVVGETRDGDGYLRRVTASREVGGEVILDTERTSLSEAMDSGTVSSTVTLFDVAAAGQSLPMIGGGTRSARTTAGAGRVATSIFWKDRLLSATQTDYVPRDTDAPRRYLLPGDAKRAIEEELLLKAGITFTPDLRTEISWNFGGVTAAEVIASGEISMDAVAEYNFKAQGQKRIEQKLFTRNWRSVYVIGGVPVYQKITLDVSAEFTATAAAAIHASTRANASAAVEIGVRYNPATGNWDPVFSESFQKSFDADLDILGEVTGEIRLVPEVKVTFYTVASASLYVEPFIFGEIAVENVSAPAGPAMRLSAFNADLGLDCFASASLRILFSTLEVLPKTPICEPCFEYPLFSLPEITLDAEPQAGEDGGVSLTAHVRDGVNNPFDAASVEWETAAGSPPSELVPGGGLENTGEGEHTCVATLTSPDPANYDVFFSGHGRLGEAGRRYAQATVRTGEGTASEATLYVDDTATGAGTGLTPEDAFTTLRAVSIHASEMDRNTQIRILVLPGTYTTPSDIKENMRLVGQSPHTVFIRDTEVSNYGLLANCGFYQSNVNNFNGTVANCVFTKCSGADCHMMGFADFGAVCNDNGVVVNCEFNGCEASGFMGSSGGVHNMGGTVADCVFTNCFAKNGGGGVSNSGTVTGCVFNGCFASYGGGADNSGGMIYESVFKNCSAEGIVGGGGVSDQSGMIIQCEFKDCVAEYDGGGVHGNNLTIVNDCVFENCSVPLGGGLGRGGGVYDAYQVIGSTFKNCVAPNGGGVGGVNLVEDCVFENCLAESHAGAVSAAYVKDCRISGCSAEYGGGLIIGTLASGCDISNCSAYYGGGIYNSGTATQGGTVTNCSVSGCAAEYGGGVYNERGTVENTTISGCVSRIEYTQKECFDEGMDQWVYKECLQTGPYAYTYGDFESCEYSNCWNIHWDCCDYGEFAGVVE